MLRHVTGWSVDSALEEYRGYAKPKVRECDVKYIQEYQISSLYGLFTDRICRPQDAVLIGPRMARIVMFTAMIIMIMFATALFW